MHCTVIIPVGPGHDKLAQVAFQSVMLASNEPGPFDAVSVIAGDDMQGQMGRSRARNAMAQPASERQPWMAVFTTAEENDDAFKSEWLFFLDADDLMCAPNIFGESAFAAVGPYLDDYDCIWGSIHELHPNGDVLRRKQVDRITTYKAYVKTPAPLSCQMGHFIRRSAFIDLGGFDENLDVCEDVDIYLREWKALRCIKQEKPLFLNRRGAHSWMAKAPGGRKRHTGREWSMRAEEMLQEARERLANG